MILYVTIRQSNTMIISMTAEYKNSVFHRSYQEWFANLLMLHFLLQKLQLDHLKIISLE